jgi:hypothetical protein
MCDYCENTRPLFGNLYSDFYVEIINGDVIDIHFYGSEQNGDGSFEINYCPMCGRKLNEQD